LSYKHNHYVPEWYQRRFLLPRQTNYFYLDKSPDVHTSNGYTWKSKEIQNWGVRKCFAQDDLYTTRWGSTSNTDIERFFFGKIDAAAPSALDFFANYKPDCVDADAFKTFLEYMSVQKLRTPKGLAWLRDITQSANPNDTLLQLQKLQSIFCATWSDCVWQIADASHSPIKFIISDHPVTLYNRECFPLSPEFIGHKDPDVRQVGTHTIFPLSLNKILILTNLAWVRNPYQNAKKMGPNKRLLRNTIFNFQDIQFDRFLSEEEVLEINFIIKRRALRYVAAAREDWLNPERHLVSDHWRKLGDGYLLMPDPRHVHMGGTTYIGYEGGRSEAFGPYGHRHWEPAFEDKARDEIEFRTLEKFKDEWAATFGPEYRGLSCHFNRANRTRESLELHQNHLDRDMIERRKPDERARRRRLRRKVVHQRESEN
jgi:hypothetical protein